jgi:hypothetical protein
MFMSDGWMIDYAGHEKAVTFPITNGTGRGIFYSSRSDKLFVVISQNIYTVVANYGNLTYTLVASIGSTTTDVFIDENLQNQIAFCDKTDIYIYDYSTSAFAKLALDFSAGYVTFQDNRFIATANNLPQWRLSDFNLLSIATAAVVSGGSGYHVGDVLTVVNGGLNQGTLTVTGLSGTAVSTVIVNIPSAASGAGSGYINTTYPVSGGYGIGATFAVTITSGFTPSSQQIGTFQSKPDSCLACVRVPGRSGQILIMGSVVTEIWTDLGLQLFPYQRNSGYTIDYGCLNPATIAASDDFVVWLGSNEKSGPTIMMCSGSGVQQISSDGINYTLSTMVNPENSHGFIFKQAGHMFYQITFPDPKDNVTYIYDFNAKSFYTLCDTNQNYHIARRVAYFNNDYYFISFNDNNLYQLSGEINTADGEEIPRIIITAPSAMPDRNPFIINNLTFPIKQGEDTGEEIGSYAVDSYIIDNDGNYLIDNDGDQIIYQVMDYSAIASATSNSRVDLSTSSDGGVTFGNPVGIYLNSTGHRRNIFKYYNLGRYNEVTFQFRFWGLGRFVLTDGVCDCTQ